MKLEVPAKAARVVGMTVAGWRVFRCYQFPVRTVNNVLFAVGCLLGTLTCICAWMLWLREEKFRKKKEASGLRLKVNAIPVMSKKLRRLAHLEFNVWLISSNINLLAEVKMLTTELIPDSEALTYWMVVHLEQD